MTFKEELQAKVADVEAGIREFLPKEEGFQKTVLEAMNYSILVGGKRLRPLFMYEMYLLFGGKDEAVIRPFMAAMEMVHTYSLVHDDLPAMDNDDYRRGNLTTHKKFGEDMGILAGDALLNYAFETAFKAFDSKDTKAEVIGKALQVFADRTGIYGMVGGQVADVELTGKTMTKEQLMFIHTNKTGGLIEAAMVTGAILAGATEEEVAKVRTLSLDVGLAFQIQDDILDIIGDEKTIGKPVHSDEKNEKTTYATFYGMEAAKDQVAEYSNQAEQLLQEINPNSEFLKNLIDSLIDRDK